jgi:hypothetical protein
MQKFAGMCSPEQLLALQRIFDLIWMELRESSTSGYNGPSDPGALRDEIARRVFSQFDGGEIDHDEITARVLISFGLESHPLRPYQHHGMGAIKRRGGEQSP